MPLPIAAGGQYLTPGIHVATPDDIEKCFVDAVPSSVRRRPLFEKWQGLYGAMEKIIPIEEQWLFGSFTTMKPEPQDIDVVTYFDGASLDALDRADQTLLRGLVAEDVSKYLHGCHSFGVPTFPVGHVMRPAYDQMHALFTGLCGSDRAGAPRGYVRVDFHV